MYLFLIIHCAIALLGTKCYGNTSQPSLPEAGGHKCKFLDNELAILPVQNLQCSVSELYEGHYERSYGVFPTDQHIEEGSDAEITCQSVSGKVFWTLNNRRVSESLSHRVNFTHTVLLLPSSLLQDPSHPTSIVECHTDDNNHQILGGTTVRIYTKPHNLTCILHSDHEMKEGLPLLFTCSWEHHINSQLKVNYSVMCGQREICTSDVTNCDISTLNASISFVKKNTIYVKAKTKAWEVNSRDYTFKASQIFKIPPRRVNVTAISGDILVEWDSLPNMGVAGRCQIKYEHTKGEEMKREVLNKTLTPGEKGRITIDTVESCRKYSVSVRCALDQAPWSYWSPERTVLTKLNNSDVKLDVWRKVSKQHGKINVHIKWKGMPSNCPGTLNYSISHAPYNLFSSSANYTRTLCSNSSCDIVLSQEAHRVNLTVFYNGDFLAEDSFYLSAFAEDESDSLHCVKNIDTKHELNGLVVSWTSPSQPVTGYVIDWTHNGNEFAWKRTEFTNATLQGLADKRPYNITVTPLFGHKTGPSTQISGVCSSFANPGNVTIDNLEAYDTSAHVSWSIRQQERCSDAVVNYTVFYGTIHGPKFYVTVTNSMQEVYLKNLKPGTYYSVHVVARARSGPSKRGEGQFKTKLFDPRLVYIFSVTGSILIIFGLCLCCTIRKLYERPVPNPGHSSLALWPQTTHPKTLMPFEPFNTPSESICECVYTEEMHQTSIMTNCKSPVISDQRNRTMPSPQNYERLYLPARTPHQCGARDSMSRLNSESSQFNPYRSQSADSPAPRTSKQNKLLAMRQQEKTPSYVSLDMFDS